MPWHTVAWLALALTCRNIGNASAYADGGVAPPLSWRWQQRSAPQPLPWRGRRLEMKKQLKEGGIA